MELGRNANHFGPYLIVENCFKLKLLSYDRLIELCNEKMMIYDNYRLPEAYLELLEKVHFEKNGKQYSHGITEVKDVNTIRRKLADLYINNADQTIDAYRKIELFTKAISMLKRLNNTENERNCIRKKLDIAQQDGFSQLKKYPMEFDISNTVKHILSCLDALSSEEYLYFFITIIPLSTKEKLQEETLRSQKEFVFKNLFPVILLDRRGKKKVMVPPLNTEIPSEADLLANMQIAAREEYDIHASIFIKYIFNEMHSRAFDAKPYIDNLVEKSYFVPNTRKNAFKTGLMAGYNYDFISSMSVLIPQIENAVRCLAEECSDVVYNIDVDGFEEVKTMDGILNLLCINECIDETVLFHIKTVFNSKFGYNMRNEIAHGLVEENEFASLQMIYIWWFILWLCFTFSRVDNNLMQSINRKLAPIKIENK